MSTPAQTRPEYTGEFPRQEGSAVNQQQPPPDHHLPGAGGPPPPQQPTPAGPPTAPPSQPPLVLVRRRSPWWAVAVAVVALLSTAALVVSTMALLRQPEQVTMLAPAPTVAESEASEPLSAAAIDDLDTALCEEIGPLMDESNDDSNTYIDLGMPGSPERDAAIPEFRATTLDWADRTQAVLDEYADPPRFITRTLQRFIDNMTLYVVSVRPGEMRTYDESVWVDATAAYGGPLGRCQELGVEW